MSLITMQGFEETSDMSYVFSDIGGVGTGSAPSRVTTARTGTYALHAKEYSRMTCPNTQAHATFIVGFSVYRLASFSGNVYIQTNNNNSLHFNFATSGAITVYRGLFGTQLGALSAGTIPATVWRHIGIEATLHDSTGSVKIYLDGSLALTISNVDTKIDSNTTFNQVATAGDIYIDDFYWLNGDATAPNTFLGDKKVLTLFPNADGTTTDFSLSTGSDHYAVLDEQPPNTTDYAYSDVDAEVELVNMTNVAAGTTNISAVQIEIYANKNDAGAAVQLEPVVKSGGSTYIGTPITLATGWTYLRHDTTTQTEILLIDPATSTAWTASGVNAAEFGVRLQI